MTSPHVVLFGVRKKPDQPSASGFCQKLETFLRHTKISYEPRDSSPIFAPKGKVPFAEITHDGRTVAVPDSHFIIQYLIENGLVKDPDELAGLTKAQKAESRAFQGYVEEVLYYSVVYERWSIDENYAITLEEVSFSGMPLPLKWFAGWYFRRRIRGLLYSAGMGRHSPEEVHRLQREAFDALEVKYTEHKYFHGEELPSRIDLTVYAFLANILSLNGNPYFTGLILESAVLKTFVKEMTISLFPEYETLLAKVDV